MKPIRRAPSLTTPRNVLIYMDYVFRQGNTVTVLATRYGLSRARINAILDKERIAFHDAGSLVSTYIAARGFESLQQVEYEFRKWEADRTTYMMEHST